MYEMRTMKEANLRHTKGEPSRTIRELDVGLMGEYFLGGISQRGGGGGGQDTFEQRIFQ